MRPDGHEILVTLPSRSSRGVGNESGYYGYIVLIRILHFLVIAGLPVTYLLAYYRKLFTVHTELSNWYLLVAHINVGLLVFLSVIAIFILRFFLPRPRSLVPLAKAAWVVSSLMHYALYLLLILMPISAYLGLGYDLPILGLWNISGFFRMGADFMNHFPETTFAFFHIGLGADLLLPLLLAIHIGAALYHHFYLRDGVLKKLFLTKREDIE